MYAVSFLLYACRIADPTSIVCEDVSSKLADVCLEFVSDAHRLMDDGLTLLVQETFGIFKGLCDRQVQQVIWLFVYVLDELCGIRSIAFMEE